MQPNPSRLPGAIAVAVLLGALATCGRDTTAPRRQAALAVTAALPPGLDLAALNLSIDHVRLIAVNSSGDTAFNQVFTFPANQSTLSLSADVPLAQSPESFQVTIQLLSGTVLLFSGTQTISLASGSNNPTAQVPVTYSGPGQNVASLTLGPLDSLLTEGATLQMRVTAKDGSGANVPSFYVSWSTSDAVAVPIDATGTLKAPLARRTITVQARAFPDTTITSSTTLQFVPLPSAVAFDSGCAQSGLPGVQLPQPIVARVLGADLLGVPGITVQFAAVGGGSVTTASAVTDSGGRARTLVTLPSVAGPAQFQATVTGLTAAVCGPTVLSSPPTQVAFKTQPATAVAGVAIGSFQVEVRDVNGTLVSGATNAVTIAIANNAGGGTLTGTKTVNAVAGVATFTGLSLDKVGTGYTLQATASGLASATSSAFNITPAALNSLVFSTQPVNLVAGATMPAVVLTALDAFANTVTTFTGNVTLAFGSHPTGSAIGGTTTVAAVAGIATFSALARFTVAGGYTLVASASGVGSTASNAFTVSPAPAVALAFFVQPTNGLAGAMITPAVVVEIEDSLGNVVTTATNAVTIAIGTNPGGASLSGTKTLNAIAGIATFAGLSLDKVGTGYTLQASATGLTSATSSAFDITPATLNNLAFTTQPVNMTAGTAFPTVVVTARDAFGNTVTSFTGNVSLAFGSHPLGATLTGTTSVAAVAGIATFSALGALPVAGGYTLVASASGVGSTASNAFTVNPAPPVTLAFLGQPTSALAGAVLTPAVIVVIKDSVGNIVTTATNAVTMAVNPASALLGGTVTRNAASGTATFNDLTVGLAGTGYTLTASATGLATATSAVFDILVRPPGVVWTNLQGGNWSDPANWSPARVPGTSDTASIVLAGSYVVNLDVNAHVAFLALGDTAGAIIMDVPTGRNLLIDSSAVIKQAGSMVLTGSDTISGAGSLSNQGSLTMDRSAITTAFFSNSSVLQASGASSVTGSFSNSGGLFVYASATGDATLTFASGFLNAGGIVLQNTDVTARNVTLAVTSGVLTNIPGSSLQSALGNAGGNRTLAAMLDNQGGVLVSQTLTIDQASATHGNSGTIILSGGDLNVILSGTRPALSNESGGLIDVGTNKLVITNQSSGSFINQPGGTLQGSGTIDIGTSSFIDDGFLNVGGAPGILNFVGPYTEGPSPAAMTVDLGATFDQFTVSDTVTLQGGTLNANMLGGVYVAGSYPIITVPAGKSIQGDFTTKNLPTNPLSGGQCSGSVVGGISYVITCP